MPKRRVYLVDDEEPIRRSASLLLKSAGFDAHAFETGTAFLDIAGALSTGTILLDIRMPNIDGLAVQEELNERNSPHSIVVMTGHGDIQSAVSALTGGAVAFIEKPFSKAHLLAVLDIAYLKLEEPAGYASYLDGARNQVDSLGKREQAVLMGLAEARSNEEIARSIDMTLSELEVARARILEQFGVEGLIPALNIAHSAKLGRGR